MAVEGEGQKATASLNLSSNEKIRLFKKCQDSAWAYVKEVKTTTLPILTREKTRDKTLKPAWTLNPLIEPGCTVRIWSLEKLADNLVEGLLKGRFFCDVATVSAHLCVEIVPKQESEGAITSFSLGYYYDDRHHNSKFDDEADFPRMKVHEEDMEVERAYYNNLASMAHKWDRIPGVIKTPDTEFNQRLLKQHGDHRRFLYLVAVGELKQSHVDKLKQIISTSSRIEAWANGKAFWIQSPMYHTYKEVSSTSSGKSTNCTSFVLDIFYDILACRASFVIANPAWCRANNMSRFPGCDKRGLIVDLRLADAPEARDRNEAPKRKRDPSPNGLNRKKRALSNRV